MTDERFVFHQDVRERSKMKTGAYHKKNGAKSKKCTLPSDHLTASQKKKLNGECMIIKMNEPYHNWKAFKKLDTETQRTYISGLVVDHAARSKDIAEMFNISASTFSAYCTKFNPNIKFNGGRVMDENWLDFITKPTPQKAAPKRTDEEIIKDVFGIDFTAESETKSEPEPEIVEEPAPVENDILVEEPVVESKPAKKVSGYNSMINMNLNLKGTKEEIMDMLNAMFGDGCSYIVYLKVSNITNSAEVVNEAR